MSYTYNRNSKFTLDRTHLLPTDSDSIKNYTPNPLLSGKTMGGSIMGAYAQSVAADGNFILDIPVSTVTTAIISTESDFGSFLHGVIVRVAATTSSSSTTKPYNSHMIRGVNYFFLDENGDPKSFTANGSIDIITSSPPSGSPINIINTTTPGFSFFSLDKIRFSYKATIAHVGSAHYIIF